MFAGAWLKKKRYYLFNFDVCSYVAWKFQRDPQDEMGRKDKTVKLNCFPGILGLSELPVVRENLFSISCRRKSNSTAQT